MSKLPNFTIGVEEEYQIIDPNTRDLKSHLSKIVDVAKIVLGNQVKAEMHQSVVEVGTKFYKNINDLEKDIKLLRSRIVDLAQNQNLLVGAAGTHPFANWKNQLITDEPRYHNIIDELQMLQDQILFLVCTAILV